MIATLRKFGGIGALILSTILIAGTASGELLTKKTLTLLASADLAIGKGRTAVVAKAGVDALMK